MCLAVPGKIIGLHDGAEMMRTGKVSFGGIIKEVNLALVPEAGVGDYVIVHAGFALSRLDEEEARRVFETFEAMDRLEREASTGSSDSSTTE